MNWQSPPAEFRAVQFERIDPARNEARFYYLGWQPALFDGNAVIRVWGRKGGYQRLLVTPFPSLEQAWPTIRSIIKTRLRRGYRIVSPAAPPGCQ